MRLLVVENREGSMGDDMAAANEKVVPNFPTGMPNTFLGLTSFKPAIYARVIEDPGSSLEKLAEGFRERFKSLPRAVLDAYMLETAKLAHRLTLGAVYQCYLDDDNEKVTLRNIKTGELHVLWDKQPVPGGYK